MIGGYADLIFHYGMADENEAAYISKQMQLAVGHIDSAQYEQAAVVSLCVCVCVRACVRVCVVC